MAQENDELDLPAQAEQLKKDLEDCKTKSEEYINGWKRERADFLNYKKDEMERIGGLLKYANEEVILKILPILDNIERAEKELPENLKKGSSGSPEAIEWTKGFLQIKDQLNNFLAQAGIEEVKTMGEQFDPNTMEAIEEVAGENPGTVIEESQKGYVMHGKL